MNKLKINLDINEYFGNWINNLDKLKNHFANTKPFNYVIIKGFLNEKYANMIHDKFPYLNQLTWHKYNNPI